MTSTRWAANGHEPKQVSTKQRSFRADHGHDHEELAILADRERIAFDLHDLVIQRIFAAGLALQSTAAAAEDPQVTRRLEDVVTELDATISDIRTTIFALEHHRDRGSTRGDLRSRVIDLSGQAATALGHDPSVRFAGPIDAAVPEVIVEQLLAVLREVLSNVRHHAHATATAIDLSVAANLLLQVTDNGVGTSGAGRTSELRNLRRRAESLGGGAELTSQAGAGTCVKWWVPCR
jgi:signal transduction histidine kinase